MVLNICLFFLCFGFIYFKTQNKTPILSICVVHFIVGLFIEHNNKTCIQNFEVRVVIKESTIYTMDPNESGLDDVKDVLNSTNSDSDVMEDDEDSRDAALKIEENIKKEDSKMDLGISFPEVSNVKLETSDFHVDLSLPQPPQNPPHKKKETKSKKEIEEEEREKMQ